MLGESGSSSSPSREYRTHVCGVDVLLDYTTWFFLQHRLPENVVM